MYICSSIDMCVCIRICKYIFLRVCVCAGGKPNFFDKVYIYTYSYLSIYIYVYMYEYVYVYEYV